MKKKCHRIKEEREDNKRERDWKRGENEREERMKEAREGYFWSPVACQSHLSNNRTCAISASAEEKTWTGMSERFYVAMKK